MKPPVQKNPHHPAFAEGLLKLYSHKPPLSYMKANLVALGVWLVTWALADIIHPAIYVAGSYSASEKVFVLSTSGLLAILGARIIAPLTGFRPFISIVPLSKPSSVAMVRFVGWTLLVLGLVAQLFV